MKYYSQTQHFNIVISATYFDSTNRAALDDKY